MTDERYKDEREPSADRHRTAAASAVSAGTHTDTNVQDSAPSTPATADLQAQLGPTIGQYELIRPLGHGGMGQVLLARDTLLGRLVAIKVLTNMTTERSARRFLAEARATARLSHENIVVIHEIGQHRKWPYMVLEYLAGQTCHPSSGIATTSTIEPTSGPLA